MLLSFTLNWWQEAGRIIKPAMAISLVFGVIDGLKASDFSAWVPASLQHLPLSEQNLSWLPPVVLVIIVAAFFDRIKGKPAGDNASH